VGMVDQDQFVNAVIKLKTSLTAEALLDVLHRYEQKYHRVRTIHWGPRTLDLDIELFNNDVINNAVLDVPHREMFNRLFVLVPLQEIMDKTHPKYQQVSDAINTLNGSQYIMRLDEIGK
ncbi:2-amino-4-hydroxy-6-hydroxymethyldihydropteridine diphosphokinase, partial [Staphylococcus aureus]|uniref:2-amino-4-hydroxy-6- hydroxymethyldihydropteridine diphosphokinase n=2 Tax=Bacilli TaxID=91061 RepID=UPI0022FE4243